MYTDSASPRLNGVFLDSSSVRVFPLESFNFMAFGGISVGLQHGQLLHSPPNNKMSCIKHIANGTG